MIPKVNSGDRLKIRALDWNAIANHVNATRLDEDRRQRQRGLYTANVTDAEILAGTCLKLGGLVFGGDLSDSFADQQVLSTSIPANGETDCILCFAAEDILAGDIGRVTLSGACYALFSSYDSSLPYAVPDGTGRLKSSEIGAMQVVWADGNTKQGLVLMGGGIGGMAGGYFDLRVGKDEGDHWQCIVFNSGETEYSGSPTGYEISGRVIVGNHTEYMPVTAVPISGQGVIYLYVEHDGTDRGYQGLTYSYVFAESVPEIGYNERKYIAPLGYLRYRNGTDDAKGYRVTHTSHSRGGAIDIQGRWV